MDAQRTSFQLSQEGRMASVEHLFERAPISSNGYEYEFDKWKRNADGIVVPEDGHGHGGDRRGPAFRALRDAGMQHHGTTGGVLEEKLQLPRGQIRR
ncbi:unnamed protein product [Closterium sp. NIES-64]|nr:unnamed protein product [Closterium sp. NIES-64]